MVVGYNSRLDELQAGLLRVKLKHIDTLLKDRERIALKYLNGIKNKKIKYFSLFFGIVLVFMNYCEQIYSPALNDKMYYFMVMM